MRVAFLSVELPLPSLRVPREEARKKIAAQLKKGREIRDMSIESWTDLERARTKQSKWVKYATTLLELLFDSMSMVEEFAPQGYLSIAGIQSTDKEIEEFRESMNGYVTRLESIRERLDLVSKLGVKPTGPKVQLPKSLSDLSPVLTKLGLGPGWILASSSLSLFELVVNRKMQTLNMDISGEFNEKVGRLAAAIRKQGGEFPELMLSGMRTVRNKVLKAGSEPTPDELADILKYLLLVSETLNP